MVWKPIRFVVTGASTVFIAPIARWRCYYDGNGTTAFLVKGTVRRSRTNLGTSEGAAGKQSSAVAIFNTVLAASGANPGLLCPHQDSCSSGWWVKAVCLWGGNWLCRL